jgi:transposase
MRFDLTESRKTARVDDRKIMNAIFYVLRTGMPWRDLPERYGPYTTAYNRFNRWSRRGMGETISSNLKALYPCSKSSTTC